MRFCKGFECEVLLGDLLEEFSDGRSAKWLWWQVLVAILLAFTQGTRKHAFQVLRAVVIGCLLLPVIQFVVTLIVIEVLGRLSPLATTLQRDILFPSEGKPGTLTTTCVIGLCSLIAAVVTGRMLAYLHPRCGCAAVVALAGCYVAVAAPWTYGISRTLGSGQATTHLVVQGSAILLTAIGLFIGGSTREARTAKA